jgi:hypothetical protein
VHKGEARKKETKKKEKRKKRERKKEKENETGAHLSNKNAMKRMRDQQVVPTCDLN